MRNSLQGGFDDSASNPHNPHNLTHNHNPLVVDLSSLAQGLTQGLTHFTRPPVRRGSKSSLHKRSITQCTDNSSETADSTHESSQSMDEDTENDNIDWSEMNSTQSSVQSNKPYVQVQNFLRNNQNDKYGDRYGGCGEKEERKEETKELILKRCAMAVQEVWPDCLSEAKTFIEKEIEKIVNAEILSGGVGSGFLSDSRTKGLIVRCIGCLLLFRDTKGKWIPQYAEPVLVAVASGICEGCSVQDYRLMMSLLGDILSHI